MGLFEMNDESSQTIDSEKISEIKSILIESLVGTAGIMWIAGGIFATVKLYDVHWSLGWASGFIWVWGCWAAALYFDVKRFFNA